MKRLLLVEDDDLFRQVLKNILSKKLQVQDVANGQKAIEVLKAEAFDIILSDIQMPFLDGVQLLAWVKEHKPTPMILMTGFSNLLETHKAELLGVDDLIPKPFRDDEIFKRISKILNDEDTIKEKESGSLSQFCKISIDDFVSEKENTMGVYVKVGDQKFVKIAHRGGRIPEEKIAALKEKGLSHLYIRIEDYSKLLGISALRLKAMSEDDKVNNYERLQFMKYTGEMLLQFSFTGSFNEGIYHESRDFLMSVLRVLSYDPEILELLKVLNSHSNELYAHSLGVCLISLIIAKNLKWTNYQELFRLAFSSLFHDIGKKEISLDILTKDPSLLTPKESTLLRSHTTRGMEIILSMNSAPPEAARVAFEHHEKPDGSGWPRGLKGGEIHPMSHIVSTANIFCRYTIAGPGQLVPLDVESALDRMYNGSNIVIEPQALSALAQAVTVTRRAS